MARYPATWGAGKNAVTSRQRADRATTPPVDAAAGTVDDCCEPSWAELLTPADRRGLTPLFWVHVVPYGEVNLDMTSRLDLAAAVAHEAHELPRTG